MYPTVIKYYFSAKGEAKNDSVMYSTLPRMEKSKEHDLNTCESKVHVVVSLES